MFHWTINKSFQVDGIEMVENLPITGPRNNRMSSEDIAIHPNSKKFRLLDDDKNVYCEGYFLDLSKNQVYDGFQPLDDYGTGGLGCTEIQYWEENEWKPL